jgi:hypothetical protein
LQLVPDCVTVNVRPATVNVPVRWVDTFVGSTRKATGPVPVPFTPPMIEIHETLLAAVHEHAAVVVTTVDPVPPFAGVVRLVGAIENEQLAAAWFTVNVWPPIVSVPLRGCVSVFAAAL